MNVTDSYKERVDEIGALFQSTFTDSEGEAEGQLIGMLARNLLSSTAELDIFAFSALEAGSVIGSIVFTRMTYPDDDRVVFLLAPVAVATSHHRQGVGSDLIRHGLDVLRNRGVDVVLTYGDINFYAKVGFAQITENVAKAPLPLQYPEGWLSQSLVAPVLKPLIGRGFCVEALNDGAYW